MWGNVTLSAPDLYGGAAVTSQNAYRRVGTDSFTDVAGAGTFNANPGSKIEIVCGVDSNDDDDEPFGDHFEYTVPCEPYPTVTCKMIDDSIETDPTVRVWDPEDGTTISAAAEVDIDNGDVFNLKYEVQGAFEEDFGNRYCEEDGYRNVLVIEYNTTQYTSWKFTDLNSVEYPRATVPSLFTGTAGYTAKAYYMPVLKSNTLNTNYLVADASGSGKEPAGVTSNVTLTVYDVDYFFNNDVSPTRVDCGVEDEDGADVGSTGALSTTIYIAQV